ncbi:MAG TPA: phage holin family protein [Solirubrobacterales bacterium]
MQLNRVGIGLIAFFGLIGAAFAVVPLLIGLPGEVAGIFASIGAIWVLVAGGLAWYARRQQRKAAHNDWIFQQGLRGTATVLHAGSHATVNEMPLMSMRLDLEVPGRGTREVKRREIMPVFAARRMEPGLTLPVYVNPQDPSDFILVW